MTRAFPRGLLLYTLMLTASSAAAAAPGNLDPTFGLGGKVTTPIGSTDDGASAVTLQPDGKLVAVGYSFDGSDADFALARYDADGNLDPTVGSGGRVTTSIGSVFDFARAVALQPDGKLVAVGSTDFALVRYNADGSLDPGFGSGGKVTTPIGLESDFAWAVALQPDGKLLAVGQTSASSVQSQPVRSRDRGAGV